MDPGEYTVTAYQKVTYTVGTSVKYDICEYLFEMCIRDRFETVLTAMTVKEAISTAKEETPDLIILDVMLPDGDGFSLMQHFHTFTNVPIIFLTAKLSLIHISLCLNVIPKPPILFPVCTAGCLIQTSGG